MNCIKYLKIFIVFFVLSSCSTDIERSSVESDSTNETKNQNQITDNGEGISLKFMDGLNDDPRFKLKRDLNGYYFLTLNPNSNQTIQRITGKLLRNGKPVEDIWTGNQPKKVNWESNLFWWLLEGDIVAKITKTYLNIFTGQITYVNLPPVTNWRDILVPTLNSNSYTDQKTGIVNTVIAPIFKMKGDTLKVKMTYSHGLNQKKFKDSTYIILK